MAQGSATGAMAPPEFDLVRFLRSIARHPILVVAPIIVLAAVGAVLGRSRGVSYQAESRVLVGGGGSPLANGGASIGPTNLTAQQLQTYEDLFSGDVVRQGVAQQLGVPVSEVPGVSVSLVGSSSILAITAAEPTAGRARAVADSYANAFITARQQQTTDALDAASKQLQARIAALQSQVDSLDNQMAAAQTAGQQALATKLATASPQQAQLLLSSYNANPPDQTLRQTRDQLVTEQGVLYSQLDSVSVQNGLGLSGAEKVSSAVVTSGGRTSNRKTYALLGVVAGLVLGMLLAGVREATYRSIRVTEDLDVLAPAVPVLGIVPRGRRRGGLVTLNDQYSDQAEAYRSVRTALQSPGTPRRQHAVTNAHRAALQFVSPDSGVDAAEVCANMAVEFAEVAASVAAVSANLREPGLERLFGVQATRGLTSVLTGREALGDVLVSVDRVPGLALLPAGPQVQSPSAALAGPDAEAVWKSLELRSDIVVADSPPFAYFTDAALVAGAVDGVVLVVRLRRTGRTQLARTLRTIRTIDARLVGIVVLDGGRGKRTPRWSAPKSTTVRDARLFETPKQVAAAPAPSVAAAAPSAAAAPTAVSHTNGPAAPAWQPWPTPSAKAGEDPQA